MLPKMWTISGECVYVLCNGNVYAIVEFTDGTELPMLLCHLREEYV
jgi:hypothetical protein